jgi:hypothetical protein
VASPTIVLTIPKGAAGNRILEIDLRFQSFAATTHARNVSAAWRTENVQVTTEALSQAHP